MTSGAMISLTSILVFGTALSISGVSFINTDLNYLEVTIIAGTAIFGVGGLICKAKAF